MPIITLEGYRCRKCGHEWAPTAQTRRAGERPRICPKCKTRAWE